MSQQLLGMLGINSFTCIQIGKLETVLMSACWACQCCWACFEWPGLHDVCAMILMKSMLCMLQVSILLQLPSGG